MTRKSEPVDQTPTDAEFEEFVDALLKVDPKGLSGKHRKVADEQGEEMRPSDG